MCDAVRGHEDGFLNLSYWGWGLTYIILNAQLPLTKSHWLTGPAAVVAWVVEVLEHCFCVLSCTITPHHLRTGARGSIINECAVGKLRTSHQVQETLI